MTEFLLSRLKSFKHAFAGWWFVISTQKNSWVHMIATICVIILSLWLKLPARDWAVLFVVIGMVWIAEFLNTALEAVVDLASPSASSTGESGQGCGCCCRIDRSNGLCDRRIINYGTTFACKNRFYK